MSQRVCIPTFEQGPACADHDHLELPPPCAICPHHAAAHDAPAGPCRLCPPDDAQHRYEPEETRP